MLELLFAALLLGVIAWVWVGLARKDDKDHHSAYRPEPVKRSGRRVPRAHAVKPKPARPAPARPRADMPVVEGPAYVVDGDSLRINKQDIRIYGVDAPELNHPYGQKAKWAMVSLCKGQRVKAKIIEEDDHGRKVAMCYLQDGRDLSEEMVKLGLALDWPKYSNGDYRMFEVPGVRKKLWLADARQKGRMHVWAQFDARQKAKRSNQPE